MAQRPEPIAIIGSACRFPGGASSPSQLWELLHHPKDVLREFSKDRLSLGAFYHPDGEHHGSTDVCNKGYLLQEDSRLFDASFFNINPAEADAMDPQQRLTMETVYESLEAAGYTLDQMQGSLTSVFLGVMTGDYHDIQQRDPETINRYHATGTSKSILSNRVSYYFDLRGPSMTLDTACSSSLAALHLAVQSLRNGESTTAIVVGVNLIFDATGYVAESKLHMLSPTSRSRMWDADADGYARGEGVAAVILKPLSEALRNGDHVECIVRETGMNSDGRTTGITMPSAAAQATLIRRTYSNAGLDPSADRPQYFECHGTGTLAGDPVEARAVRDSFFPMGTPSSDTDEKLYCGSIKTIIGHTEGCAGLAGLLKASLALQNGIIPPNMLFKTLNPAIKPFYDRLLVPTSPMSWPKVTNGQRRVSLNSFGFGGTNVHAIIENYISEPVIHQEKEPTLIPSPERFIGPLVLSSESESSLSATIQNFADFIRANPNVDLKDLAFVTQTRRTAFSFRSFFSGETRTKLLDFLDAAVQTSKNGAEVGMRVPSTTSSEPPAILGIFTGQGAQWASMGRLMVETSFQFRDSIQKCEEALKGIPDAPTWSLMAELIASEDESRIGEAAISQPLCTATQIAIVNVLAAAGVHFDAVVGHSSGEIAAVYAAGLISATDGMRIAYYRGFHAKLAQGQDELRGAMMAIGLGYDDAISFCDQPRFKNRIGLAASNSPSSTTLSGDKDAIMEAKEILDDQKTFTRLLKVDTAYHSHHMLACAEPYLKSLRACNIKINLPSKNCVWISSVYGNAELLDDEEELSVLSGQYWVDNMVRPVLFSEGMECSLWRAGPFNLALEIGPHPALKGPASQTMKSAIGTILPYATFLRRGYDDVEAFSGGIGYIWTYLGTVVDFVGYHKAIHGPALATPKMLKGLPAYCWNHKVHWKEARLSKRYRLAEKSPHELLGRRTGDDSDTDMRWRNILKLNELPWVRGHVFQGQVLFPTSGYMAMAIQAAMEIAGARPVKLIEIRDLIIPRAVTLEEDHPGVESVFSVKKSEDGDVDEAKFRGDFACFTTSSDATGGLERNCAGSITIEFGEASFDTLPPRAPGASDIAPVDTEEYYASLLNIGLNYQGLFRGIKSVQRTMGYATTKASWLQSDVGDQYVMHPGPLDVAFHSIIAAFCTPLSGALWAPYLPVKVDRLALTPYINYEGERGEINFDVDTFVTKTTANTFEGDIHIISPNGRTGVQAEGLTLKLFTEARPSDDRPMFSKSVWDIDFLGASSNVEQIKPDAEELALAEAIDRTSLYYIKKTFERLTDADVAEWKWFHKAFYKTSKICLQETRDGKHPTAKKEWLSDSEDLIIEYKRRYAEQADLKLIHAVAESLAGVMTADVQLLEVMLAENMLSNLYTDGRAMKPLNRIISELMQNLAHKYPRLKILEIGAGTGGTTNSVLSKIGDAYGQYTYTDISAGFFENAKLRFAEHSKRLVYKVLDIERDPAEQGFELGNQDIILAANVLHATHSLSETLLNVRKLLKPGGYLIMMEVTGEFLQMTFLMGGLQGWWLGVDEGRTRGPGISLTKWDEILSEAGFSGAEKYVTDLPDSLKHACSVIVSQAVDGKLNMLKDPMSFLDEMPLEERMLVVGGKTLPISRIAKSIERLASRFTDQLMVVDSIDALADKHLQSKTSVICITELEKPLFSETLTDKRLKKLQALFSQATNTLWVTAGRLNGNPYANMTVGLGRALITELPQLNLQFLDVTNSSNLDARFFVEMFLKLKLAKSPEFKEHIMLWSTEPEILCQDDVLHIPRVIMDRERNDRLNSLRRTITRDASLGETTIVISTFQDSIILEQEAPWLKSFTAMASEVVLQVQQSISLPFRNNGPYLCAGKIEGSEEIAVAIAQQHRSKVIIPPGNAYILVNEEPPDPSMLRNAAIHLTAYTLLSSISTAAPKASAILMYEATPELVQVLQTMPHPHKIFFARSSKETDPSDLFIYIHPRASARTIRHILPRSIEYVVDLSAASEDIVRTHLFTLYDGLRYEAGTLSIEGQSKMLEKAYSTVKSLVNGFATPTVTVQDLPSLTPSYALYPNIVDWTRCDQPVPVIVRPINGSGLFSAEKTYLMIGLVSDLGRSICRWMVENGAKYIVLTSRSAKVERRWIREMEALGAVVKVYRMDVSKRDSVQSVCDIIKETLPPVGGVCNGALVLRDQLFVEMEADALNNVFAPKVDGSVHLHEIFSEPTLDFFILFSSMSSVVGNAGQANYNAASLFQAAIANERRAKGLAASVMSLGLVADVGYIAQRGPSLVEKLKKVFYMPISEADAHLIFAEAVIASKPENGDATIEIVSGIQPFNYTTSTNARPPWFANPRFSHFVRHEEESQEATNGCVSNVDVKGQMDVAASEDEAAAALLAAFTAKLESMLQMATGSLNAEAPLLDVGIDSLLAVEIRTWFLKEVHVDVPILKTLSGDNARDICANAATKYLAAKMQEGGNRSVEEHFKAPTEQGGSLVVPDLGTRRNSESSTIAGSSGSDKPGTTTDASSVGDSGSQSDPAKSREMIRVEKLSFAQSRLWFLSRLSTDPTSYNSLYIYTIKGKVQIPRLRRAIATVVAHHDSLHTCFFSRPGTEEPVRGLLKAPKDSLKHIHTSDQSTLGWEVEALKSYRWQLADGDVFKAVLITYPTEEQYFIIAYHHIVMDGVSFHLFMRDLNAAYTGKALNRVSKQYMDLSADERKVIESGRMDEKVAFWKREHSPPADVFPLLPFSRVKSRPATNSYTNNESIRDLGANLSERIKRTSQALRVTPIHFYLAAMQALFSRLTGTENFCIGVTDANRNQESSQTVGFFLNLLPLRFQILDSDKYADLVIRTSQQYYAAQSNSGVPLDLVLEKSGVRRDVTHTPLFQVALNYRQGKFSQLPLGSCQMEFKSGFDAKSPYDLAFSVTPTEGTCYLQVVSRADLYSRSSTDLLLDLYATLLEEASSDPQRMLSSYKIYNTVSIDKAMTLGCGPRVDFRWPATLTERVDDITKQNGEEIAVKDAQTSVTYVQLAEKVDRLATALSKVHAGMNSRIAVLCEPSADWVISMLAVLRIGGVYVPLDSNLPDGRLAAILRACKPVLMIYHDATSPRAQQLFNGLNTVNITELPKGSKTTNMEQPNKPAFILFTSGSTGSPKGIELSQAGIINYLATKKEILSQCHDIVLQQSALGFDMSIAQAFNALAHGGTLVIAPQTSRGDPMLLAKLMLDEGVTLTLATPTEYVMLLRHAGEALRQQSSWRHACTGGEAVTRQLIDAFRILQRKPVLVDCYGPTEISCCATMRTVDLNEHSDALESAYGSVGTANPNTTIYIMDENENCLPIGMPGEICVSGVGVAIRYLDPDLSKQRFIPNSFASNEDKSNGWNILYRTGDKGLLRPDGALQFMGRLDGDTTIKLRGLRIDLDDVANSILQTSRNSISDAIVTVRGEPSFLVAHVVLAKDSSTSEEDLQSLANVLPLPQYMRPSMVIPLERLPMNNNGKVDRKVVSSLPLPKPGARSTPGGERLNLAEGELRLLWDSVLRQQVGSAQLHADTDFFLVGGTSFLLVMLQGAIRTSMGVTLSLTDLYHASTLGRMAALITRQKSAQYSPETIDWDRETALPRSLDFRVQSSITPKSTKRLEIILTGSNGFLGGAVLSSLLKNPAVHRVHCIAVDPDTESMHANGDRIAVYPGRLVEPRLGLGPEAYTRLQATADGIILAHAQGHCLNNYFSLRVPNVHSTQQMALFALPRRIPIHYLSSNRVTLLDPSAGASLPPLSLAEHKPPQDGSEGFTAAKWAGEVFLEKLARAARDSEEGEGQGLPITIHRPCAVVGEQAPLEDALNALLRNSRLMQAVPRVSSLNVDGYFDFRDVDDVADEIVMAAVDSARQEQANVTFRHHSSGVKVTPEEFRQYMEKIYGGTFKELSLDEWIDGARREGIEELIVSYLQAVTERGERMVFPFMGRTV